MTFSPSLSAIEVATVVTGALRFWAVAVLIGASLDAAGALSMAFTTPAAAALGIFPSGIGVREALIGGAAKVILADASLLFLAATIERVVSLVAAVPLLTWSLWGGRRGARTPAADGGISGGAEPGDRRADDADPTPRALGR